MWLQYHYDPYLTPSHVCLKLFDTTSKPLYNHPDQNTLTQYNSMWLQYRGVPHLTPFHVWLKLSHTIPKPLYNHPEQNRLMQYYGMWLRCLGVLYLKFSHVLSKISQASPTPQVPVQYMYSILRCVQSNLQVSDGFQNEFQYSF